MHDSSTCPICRGQPINGSFTDDAFNAFVAACHAELEDKQRVFWPQISGAGRWRYELDEGSIFFGGDSYPMIPIGTFSPEYQSWLWAWANEDFPELARATSHRLQDLNVTTGFRVFLDPGFPISPDEVNDLVAMSIHQLGAIGFFRSPSEGPTLYLAILDPVTNATQS